MSPSEIASAYEVVAADLQNRTAEQAARIGNAQRSLGTLAERVASPSGQTSGLANYTYERTLRPTIDVLSTSLVTQGKANALSDFLRNELSKAKQNYQNAAATATSNANSQLLNEITDNAYTGTKLPTEETPGAGYSTESGASGKGYAGGGGGGGTGGGWGSSEAAAARAAQGVANAGTAAATSALSGTGIPGLLAQWLLLQNLNK